MTDKEQLLKGKLEEIKRLAQEAEELIKEIIESDEYDTDLDIYKSIPLSVDNIWSEAHHCERWIDEKERHEQAWHDYNPYGVSNDNRI